MTCDKKKLLRQIFNRMKDLEGVNNDVDLAAPLKTNKRNISAWKERGTIPWEILAAYCSEQQVSLEWLINAQGPRFVAEMVAEPGAIYKTATNQDVLYTLSGNIYRALQDTGRILTPEKFTLAVRLLHRDMIERRATDVPYEKVLEVVKLAG